MTLPTTLPTRDDIKDAHRRIRAHVRRTPVMDASLASLPEGASLSLKLEFLQHAGSFKSRGAFNNLAGRSLPAAGVATASGGNHGAAVAYAAQQLGLTARVFVPEISPAAKVAKIRSCGAEVVVRGARYFDALGLCKDYVRESGAFEVHAYDTAATIAGQGTVALEWEEDNERLGGAPLDTVLIAVGGGGLIAGVALWFKGRTKVVGVEPEGSRALHAALAAGHPVDVEVDSVAGDSLGAKSAGELVHAIARHAVDHVALVPDAAIIEAQRRLWADYRIAVEPGGAAAYAALLCGAYRPKPGERVGILICGANVDLDKLAALV